MLNLHILEARPKDLVDSLSRKFNANSDKIPIYVETPENFFGVVIDIIGEDKNISKTYLQHQKTIPSRTVIRVPNVVANLSKHHYG